MKLIPPTLFFTLFAVIAVSAEERVPFGWVQMCADDPRSLLCAESLFVDMKKSHIYSKDIDRHGRRDLWKSQLFRYLNRNVIAGDCEDFAITMVELALILDLAEPEDVSLTICRVPGQRVTHAVAVVSGRWFDYRHDEITTSQSNRCKPIQSLNLATLKWTGEQI